MVVDLLVGRETTQNPPSNFESLKLGVYQVFARRSGLGADPFPPRGHPQDDELIRDVFWDLFRQGAITLGSNDANPNWPNFRLSHFGARTLAIQSPWRFHDTSSYLTLVRKEVTDISDEAVAYLDEAVQAFYAQCLLASSVMLGVAAEAEFLRLVEVAVSRPTVGARFKASAKEKFIRQKIARFLPVLLDLSSQLDKKAVEDLAVNLGPIQSVLRIARNDAGHPSSAVPQRENVYVNLQLFVPFARQLMRLRHALLRFDPDPATSGP